LLQQRFLGHEKEYFALKDLADEVASLLGARIYHMQRLALSLRRGSDVQISNRVVDYDDVVKRWNERLTSFYVRLPLLAHSHLDIRLESWQLVKMLFVRDVNSFSIVRPTLDLDLPLRRR
jgi:hypothetical protein